MRKIVSNREVARLWAEWEPGKLQEAANTLKRGCRSFSFYGYDLYSYSVKIARRIKSECGEFDGVLINSHYYSPATEKHKSFARQAFHKAHPNCFIWKE